MKSSVILTALLPSGALSAHADVPLNKVWSKAPAQAAASARSGVGTNGKFYLIEQNKGLHVYDSTGEIELIPNSTAWVSVNCDDAGHVYFRNDVGGWAGPAGDGSYVSANARFCVYDAVKGEMAKENVSMAGIGGSPRFDTLPHINGDMTAGAFSFVVPPAWTRTMFEFVYSDLNSAPSALYSEAPIAYYDGGLATANSTTGITQMYDNNHLAVVLNASPSESYKGSTGKGNAIGIFERTSAGNYKFLGYADTPNRSGVAGFHIFDCKGDKYIVYPTGQVSAASQASADGFAVNKLNIVSTPANTESTPLALNYASIELGETFPRYFNVEAVAGESTIFNIYLYSPGKIMSVYTLDLSSLYPQEQPEYTAWNVSVNGAFNNWEGTAVNPNNAGIASFENLAIGAGEFEVSVNDGTNVTLYGNGTAIAVGEWVELTGNQRMTVAGATEKSVYNVDFNVVNNSVMLTEVEQSQEPEYTINYSFNTEWRADMRSTSASTMRQGVGYDGKMYIANTQYGVSSKGFIEVWGENGHERDIEINESGVIGTNITIDEAGNILARVTSFPGDFGGANDEAVIIAPNGDQTPVTLDKTHFFASGSCSGRQDFWGHVKGNMLSDEGGCFTFGCSGSAHTDVKIVNGKHVGGESSRSAYWADGDFPHSTTGYFHSYSFMPDAALYQAGPNQPLKYVKREPVSGTYKWFARGEFKTPETNGTVGSAMFQLNDETYLVYSRGGNNADGVIIVKARLTSGTLNAKQKADDDSDIVYRGYAEIDDNGTTIYNGGFYNHFNVQVDENGETAYIYQFSPGNFSAMHVFTAKKQTTGVEEVMTEATAQAQDCAPVYYNLQGVRVANPESGLYIEVRGNKTSKVIIR